MVLLQCYVGFYTIGKEKVYEAYFKTKGYVSIGRYQDFDGIVNRILSNQQDWKFEKISFRRIRDSRPEIGLEPISEEELVDLERICDKSLPAHTEYARGLWRIGRSHQGKRIFCRVKAARR